MKGKRSRRLGAAFLLVGVALGMVGLLASAASAQSLDSDQDSAVTPTTMSCMSTLPDPDLPLDTNPPQAPNTAVSADTTVAAGGAVSTNTSSNAVTTASSETTLPMVVAAVTSIPTPVGIEAGGGGAAGRGIGGWMLLALMFALAGGLALSTAHGRQGIRRE